MENMKEILLGTGQTKMGLSEIHDLREKLSGKEMEPDNIVPLLIARIAELEIIVDQSDCILHAAEEHIKTLECMMGSINAEKMAKK